jgi:uncharacterized protein (DUF1697 family)
MPTAVALLRGINVGKAKRVPMAELRALLESLGYGDVQTLLNSGNAVFTYAKGGADAHAKTIAEALRAHFGFAVPVVVKSAATLETIVAQNTLAAPGVDPSRLLVIFAQDARPPAALRALASVVRPPDQLVIGELAGYLHCPNGILASPTAERALGGLGELITTRNWATVLKLSALATASGAKPSLNRTLRGMTPPRPG